MFLSGYKFEDGRWYSILFILKNLGGNMLRHLQNLNELVIYASISCFAAFIGRLIPAFYFPILLLRLAIVGYCIYIIRGEGNKELAVVLCGSVLLGMIGGNWDFFEIYLRYNYRLIGRWISIVLSLAFIITGLSLYAKTSEK